MKRLLIAIASPIAKAISAAIQKVTGTTGQLQ